jgi:hypothetical protein
LNCEDPELKKIVEKALEQSPDNLDAARKIESEAAARFGGRYNSIVSNSEFAYVSVFLMCWKMVIFGDFEKFKRLECSGKFGLQFGIIFKISN